ncbi:MAG TPA: hypothetical protein PLJ47_08685 [Candidatus Hydrogenedentes bacterium]|nr:hypothetical protein [Candidatus Hydrogenedentota bacterium]
MLTIATKILFIAILAGFACTLVMAFLPETALASSGDQNLAEKKGIEGLFKGKGIADDDPRLAKPWQKYLAWGSIVVTIIVWKYL